MPDFHPREAKNEIREIMRLLVSPSHSIPRLKISIEDTTCYPCLNRMIDKSKYVTFHFLLRKYRVHVKGLWQF